MAAELDGESGDAALPRTLSAGSAVPVAVQTQPAVLARMAGRLNQLALASRPQERSRPDDAHDPNFQPCACISVKISAAIATSPRITAPATSSQWPELGLHRVVVLGRGRRHDAACGVPLLNQARDLGIVLDLSGGCVQSLNAFNLWGAIPERVQVDRVG
jgi:hypothetical protein